MSGEARIGRCPGCGQPSRLDTGNRWRPFCSERCRLIDLGDWLDGRHRLPGTPLDPLQAEGEASK